METRKYTHGYRKLLAWREAHGLTLAVYQCTKNFPTDERFGITSQLRRASSSIGAQIAEGSRMPTPIHRKLYYDRAYASAAEVDNFLELAKDLQYLDIETYNSLLERVNHTSFLTLKLSQSCTNKPLTIPTEPTIPTLPTKQVYHNHAPEAAR
ncbi:MAG: four helix bundle protein [Candidatus Peribacteraceae bacterium]|nr:four helix bundle protein [Candidatus Peribacteraceae bacterium]